MHHSVVFLQIQSQCNGITSTEQPWYLIFMGGLQGYTSTQTEFLITA